MFKHIVSYEVFSALKVAYNETDTQYQIGGLGSVINGVPDIKWQSIAFIKDVQKIWTHGQLYDCSGGSDNIGFIEIGNNFSTGQDLYELLLSSEQLNMCLDDNITTLVISSSLNEKVCVLQRTQKTIEERGLGLKCHFSGIVNNTRLILTVSEMSTWLEYNELALKSDIPTVNESTVSDWGFTKNTGTITGVSANGTSVATSGVANIPAASTSAYGVTKLSSATNSNSEVLAATPKAVKAAYDLANNYKGTVTGVKINGTTKNPSSGVVDLGTVITSHQTLKTINNESIVGSGNVSVGTLTTVATQETVDSVDGFKTINGQSIIGSGNIEISGGGGKEIVEVTVSSGSIAFTGLGPRPSFEPNKIYYAASPVNESVSFFSVVQPTDDVGEYVLHFTTTEDESWAGILSFDTPSNWLWANGEIPSLETNTHYELSVVATKLGTDYIYKAVLTPFKSV
jgi:hypothetical protein